MNYDPEQKDDLDYLKEMFEKLLEKTILTPELFERLDKEKKEWRREKLNSLKRALGFKEKQREIIKEEQNKTQSKREQLRNIDKRTDPKNVEKELHEDKKKKQNDKSKQHNTKEAPSKSAEELSRMTPKERGEYFKKAPANDRTNMIKAMKEAVQKGSIIKTSPTQTMDPQKTQQAKQAQRVQKGGAGKAPAVKGGGRAR